MHSFHERVAVVGYPNSSLRYASHAQVEWTPKMLNRLTELGFTQVQVNLAWGSRPDDEPLNLEDLVEVPAGFAPQAAELNSRPGASALERRRQMVQDRSKMAHAAGLKTLFHFGAPYNRHAQYGDTPPNCLLDPEVHRRYEALLSRFAVEFPEVDDILLYTYDQDAWLCGEFGGCPRCNGIPLHRRLPAFIETMRKTWVTCRPQGTLWWEPWELSAGQVHACLPVFNPQGFGLALHANIAECMAAEVADPWLVNTCRQASELGIPVWVEWFLGGLSEELEPLTHLAHPLTILRGLRRLKAVQGLTGLKEYYGLLPERSYDPNLEATSLFLCEPSISDENALKRLSQRFGRAAGSVAEAWQHASEAMERFPWDCSWLVRQIGKARTDHALLGALLKPMLCPTPSWQSSRGSVYLRTEDTPAHPWLLEDVGLRSGQAAELAQRALEAIELAKQAAPNLLMELERWERDLRTFARRAISYSCHLRATCLAIAGRRRLADHHPISELLLAELTEVLIRSRENHFEDCRANGRDETWLEIDRAILELTTDSESFLAHWLQLELQQEDAFSLEAPEGSRGTFTLTSR